MSSGYDEIDKRIVYKIPKEGMIITKRVDLQIMSNDNKRFDVIVHEKDNMLYIHKCILSQIQDHYMPKNKAIQKAFETAQLYLSFDEMKRIVMCCVSEMSKNVIEINDLFLILMEENIRILAQNKLHHDDEMVIDKFLYDEFHNIDKSFHARLELLTDLKKRYPNLNLSTFDGHHLQSYLREFLKVFNSE